MRVTANSTGYDAVTHWGFEHSSKPKPEKKVISTFVDDGRSITTIPRIFCEDVDAYKHLFKERRGKSGIIMPAYTFNLIAEGDGNTLARVFPLAAGDKNRKQQINITNSPKHSLENIKAALNSGEPTVLVRDGEKFALLCPADRFVLEKVAELMKVTLK